MCAGGSVSLFEVVSSINQQMLPVFYNHTSCVFLLHPCFFLSTNSHAGVPGGLLPGWVCPVEAPALVGQWQRQQWCR